jgi:hypothetical protein
VLSSAAVFRLRMLLAVLAGTAVVGLAVLAVFLVIGAATAETPSSNGGDWGAVY